MKKNLLILSILLLTSCAAFQQADDIFGFIKKLTTDVTQSVDKKVVDSIVIKFDEVYWRELPDTNYDEYEKAYIKTGYKIRRIVTSDWRRYFVQKKDTVIYFYKK
jgi:hypothetical protein